MLLQGLAFLQGAGGAGGVFSGSFPKQRLRTASLPIRRHAVHHQRHELASQSLHRRWVRGACALRLRRRHRAWHGARAPQGFRRLAWRELRALCRACGKLCRHHRQFDGTRLPARLRTRAFRVFHWVAGGALVFLVLQARRPAAEPSGAACGRSEPCGHRRSLLCVLRSDRPRADAGRSLRRRHEHAGPGRNAGGAERFGLSGRRHCRRLCVRLSAGRRGHHRLGDCAAFSLSHQSGGRRPGLGGGRARRGRRAHLLSGEGDERWHQRSDDPQDPRLHRTALHLQPRDARRRHHEPDGRHGDLCE